MSPKLSSNIHERSKRLNADFLGQIDDHLLLFVDINRGDVS